MVKKRLIIADLDAAYINSLCDFIWANYADRVALVSCKNKEELATALKRYHDTLDAVLLTQDFIDEDYEPGDGVVTMILSGGTIAAKFKKYPIINKYQAADDLIADFFAKLSSMSEEEISTRVVTKSTRLISVYSPVGGSGKTTVAILLSKLLASQGSVLFLTTETLQYSEAYFTGQSDYSMSDLLFHIADKDKNIIFQLKKFFIKDTSNNIYFFNNVYTIKDLEAVDTNAWLYFYKTLLDAGIFDYVVVDFPAGLTSSVLEVLNISKTVVTPVLDDKVSLLKLNSLRKSLENLGIKKVFSQMLIVINKYEKANDKSFFTANEIEINARIPLENGHVFDKEYKMSNELFNEMLKIKDMVEA